jgi:hypothetical protein
MGVLLWRAERETYYALGRWKRQGFRFHRDHGAAQTNLGPESEIFATEDTESTEEGNAKRDEKGEKNGGVGIGGRVRMRAGTKDQRYIEEGRKRFRSTCSVQT